MNKNLLNININIYTVYIQVMGKYNAKPPITIFYLILRCDICAIELRFYLLDF